MAIPSPASDIILIEFFIKLGISIPHLNAVVTSFVSGTISEYIFVKKTER